MDFLKPFKTWDRVITPQGEGFVNASWGGMTRVVFMDGRAMVFKDREIKKSGQGKNILQNKKIAVKVS